MAFLTLSDGEWETLKSVLPASVFYQKQGYPKADVRCIFNSIFYVLDSGCKWSQIPKTEPYASKSSAHRWLQRWEKEGILHIAQDAILSKNLAKKTS